MGKKLLSVLLAAFMMLVSMPAVVSADDTIYAVHGNVIDESDTSIIGATVTVTNDSGYSDFMETSNLGYFIIDTLPGFGEYTITITMDSCETITDTFTLEETEVDPNISYRYIHFYDCPTLYHIYPVTVDVNDETMGTASAEVAYAKAGQQVTLTATPNEFYRFVEWQSADATIADNKFTMPASEAAVTAVFASKDDITVADVLATVEGGFPTNPLRGWVNGSGSRLHCENNLVINGNQMIGRSAVVTLIDDNFIYDGHSGKWTFNMENGHLVSVTVSEYEDASKNGTYVPATLIDEINFSYTDFDFVNFTTTLPTTPDGSNYGFDFAVEDSYRLVLMNNLSPVAISKDNGTTWYDYAEVPNLVDPNKLDFNMASMIALIRPGNNYGFASGLTVKGNDIIYYDAARSGVQMGTVEAYCIDRDNAGIDICIQFASPDKVPNTLTITKADGTPAVSGKDYKWVCIKDAFILEVITDNLTVSGADKENNIMIETDHGVSNLTVKNLILETSREELECIRCLDDATINVLGNNTLTVSCLYGSAISTSQSIVLTGSGNLTAIITDSVDSSVLYAGDITLDMSGNLECTGDCNAILCENLIVTDNIGKAILRSMSDLGAIAFWPTGSASISSAAIVTGSSAFDAAESNITKEVIIGDEVESGEFEDIKRYELKDAEGTPAKSVLIKATTPIDSIDLSEIGDGWIGMTLADAKSIVDAFAANEFEMDEYRLYIKNGSEHNELTDDDYAFEAGSTYEFAAFLSAKKGYFFPGKDAEENNYVGTTVPEDMIQKTIIDSKELNPVKNSDYIFVAFEFKAGYKIIEGNEAVINVDEINSFTFASNAPYNKFFSADSGKIVGKVLIDDAEVDPSKYSHASGSTEITFGSYLSKLVDGKHSLTIVSSDGQASTTFTITRNKKPTPLTPYNIPNTGVK